MTDRGRKTFHSFEDMGHAWKAENKTENSQDSSNVPNKETHEAATKLRQNQWQDKMRQLETPDAYGYVIDKGVRETVAALQLLGFNTTQSDQGNYSITPWVEFYAELPKDVYVGEQEAKQEIMTSMGVTQEEINSKSQKFDRSKQVDVEDGARERLASAGAAFTPEFVRSRQDTFQQATRLMRLVDEFYAKYPAADEASNLQVKVVFPYNEPNRPPHIRHIAFLQVTSTKETTDETENPGKAVTKRREEMDKFATFLRERFLSI